jgi:ubiquinone/menaquinone biosynthesis C-methylase UbiE
MSTERSTAGDFTAQAGFYARARPDYPDELVDALMRDAGVRPGDLAVDVGAGTGISSRCLARHGLAVVAVEPNAAMRAQADAADQVEWRTGSFEATGAIPELLATLANRGEQVGSELFEAGADR